VEKIDAAIIGNGQISELGKHGRPKKGEEKGAISTLKRGNRYRLHSKLASRCVQRSPTTFQPRVRSAAKPTTVHLGVPETPESAVWGAKTDQPASGNGKISIHLDGAVTWGKRKRRRSVIMRVKRLEIPRTLLGPDCRVPTCCFSDVSCRPA
jgi:hypothetical protein